MIRLTQKRQVLPKVHFLTVYRWASRNCPFVLGWDFTPCPVRCLFYYWHPLLLLRPFAPPDSAPCQKDPAQLLTTAGTCQHRCRNLFPYANESKVQAATHQYATSRQCILKCYREQSRVVNKVLKTIASISPAAGLSGAGRAGRVLYNPRAEDTTPPKVAQHLEGHVWTGLPALHLLPRPKKKEQTKQEVLQGATHEVSASKSHSQACWCVKAHSSYTHKGTCFPVLT